METLTSTFDPPMRRGIHPTEVTHPLTPAPPLQYESKILEDATTVLEKDVAIPMRDGVKLYANVFRPIENVVEKTPSIILFSPFGKHGAVPTKLFHDMGVDFDKLSKYTGWELPDPLVWCGKHHYSLVIVDARGTWWSEGEAAYYFSPEEGRDGYDIVEWVADQPWSTGRIGWGAVSYYAMSSYQVAALKPPHLAAIMPWEGMSDVYRETHAVGGIPSVPFQHFWSSLTANGLSWNENPAAMLIEHPLFTKVWASKVADWSKIDVPAFSVTGWSSLAVHLRGTINAWKAFQSNEKWLWIHAGREWEMYYSDEGQRRQKAFWDRFLKDQSTEVDQWNTIELEARVDLENNITRYAQNWPPSLPLTPLALGPNEKLEFGRSISTAAAEFVSYVSHDANSSAQWNHTFSKRTEITGDTSLKLFVQALGNLDTDIYVAIQKIARDGTEIQWYNVTQVIEASAMHGWLRVSHREKDQEESRPGRPVHMHQRRQWLRQHDIVEVEVEIWPSSTIWEEGETLRVVVQGQSFFAQDVPVTTRRTNSHSFGEVRIWFGGDYDSHLLAPVSVESLGKCGSDQSG